jgi:hypothetical protein
LITIANIHAHLYSFSPFVLGCQDKSFILDGKKYLFPEVPTIVPYIVDLFLSSRHKELWQFNPSTLYGKPHPLPSTASEKDAKILPTTLPVVSRTQSIILPSIMVVIVAILITLYLDTWFR